MKQQLIQSITPKTISSNTVLFRFPCKKSRYEYYYRNYYLDLDADAMLGGGCLSHRHKSTFFFYPTPFQMKSFALRWFSPNEQNIWPARTKAEKEMTQKQQYKATFPGSNSLKKLIIHLLITLIKSDGLPALSRFCRHHKHLSFSFYLIFKARVNVLSQFSYCNFRHHICINLVLRPWKLSFKSSFVMLQSLWTCMKHIKCGIRNALS